MGRFLRNDTQKRNVTAVLFTNFNYSAFKKRVEINFDLQNMKIAIVKYNAGNIQSLLFALERLGQKAVWTDDPAELRAADRVIFPGVGEASSAMQYLKKRGLDEVICSLQQPVLGICLGLQLFCRHSAENETDCLGIFETDVLKFSSAKMKVPQIGWNQISNLKTPLFSGIPENSFMYFVHSFFAAKSENTIAETEYGSTFSAALQKENFYSVQFHPEKSGKIGQRILDNFLKIK